MIDHQKITHASLARVLDGTPIDAITGDKGLYSGSDLLNAHTLGCYILRKSDPNSAFVSEALSQTPDMSPMELTLTRFLSQSLMRNGTNKQQFRMSMMSGEDACIEAEAKFMAALGHDDPGEFIATGDRVNKVYINDRHEPVLFKKGMSIPTAIGAASLRLNGIDFPAGMLYQVIDQDLDGEGVTNSLTKHPLTHIKKVIPLRLSAFAFAPHDRDLIFSEDSLQVIPEPGMHIPLTNDLTLAELLTPLNDELRAAA